MTERPNRRLLIVIAVGVWLNVVLQFFPGLTTTGRRIEDLHGSDFTQGFALDHMRDDLSTVNSNLQEVQNTVEGIAVGACVNGKICYA